VRSRSPGMWWGNAIEAPDPAALARFYADLLGFAIVHEQPGTSVVAIPDAPVFWVFQHAEGYEPPVWPAADGEQRSMMHLDIQVGDLTEAVEEAVALGARLCEHQPQPHVRVLLDPAGRPFCLCLETD
jgi:catechol 2,3-dioxygenase-like lactoylglutathione lyase family enzyme